MVSFPLSLWDISLWLAFTTIILFVTLEMLSPLHARINIYVNREKLRKVAFGVSILFFATVAIEVISLLLSL